MPEWWQAIQNHGAVWQHPGDSRAPHVVLRRGAHSDGFVDTLKFLSRVENLALAARALGRRMNQMLGHEGVSYVFGSPMAGIPLATAIAPLLGADHVVFTEKQGENELICRFDVPNGARVLLIEEMITTGGTPRRGMDAILARSPKAIILPFVGAFLIRCSKNPRGLVDASLVPVVDLPELGVHFNEWDAAACPLCKAGSRPIRNCKRVWADLLQTMEDPTHPVP